jgi:hypothetical protein
MGVRTTAKVTVDLKELTKLKRKLTGLRKGGTVDVGYFGGKIHPSKFNVDGETIAGVAFKNEFGNPAYTDSAGQKHAAVPQRDFMRTTILVKHRKDYPILLKNMATRIFEGDLTSRQALVTIGKTLQANIRETIHQSPALFQENADATVALKGHDHPLIGTTGSLLRTITYKVNRSK